MIPSENNVAGEQRLDQILRSYREATGFADASPNFMPLLWQRIEARRSNSFVMRRFARVFASASVALAIFAGMFVSLAPQRSEDDTWVEALANHHLAQNGAYDAAFYEPVRLGTSAR